MKITKENIKKAFVSHTEMIGDYVYNNQDWYEEDAERMRYILATLDMSPGDPYSDDKQLKLGQEDNRFYNCIEFDYEGGYTINDEDRLRELITMSGEDVAEYIADNEYEWIGDDYEHAGEYLFKIMNNWQKVIEFDTTDLYNDDCCTITKKVLPDLEERCKRASFVELDEDFLRVDGFDPEEFRMYVHDENTGDEMSLDKTELENCKIFEIQEI